MVLIAVLAAIAAGACFASAGLLQQRAASTRAPDESLSPRLLADLARQPMWLGGISLAVASYGFQGLALANGPLSVVQPLIVLEVVFALPLSARINHVKMRLRDWAGACMVTGGLALALFMAAPSKGAPRAPTVPWMIVLGAVGLIVVVALLLGRRGHGPLRASLYALAGGSVMGTQSALFDTTIANLEKGAVAVVTSWQTYVLIIASIGGMLLIQSAFNSGPLAASMPVIDATEPTLAVVIGLTLFGEHFAPGVIRHVFSGVGAVIALGGIVVLDTSPTTRRIRQKEKAEQKEQQEQQAEQDEQEDGGGAAGAPRPGEQRATG